MQHFYDLGRVGLGSRLKIISSSLADNVNILYEKYGIEMDAWLFPLLTLIEREEELTLREAEMRLGTSHAYISQTASALCKKGLIETLPNPLDKRSKIMRLTPKGQDMITKARPLWNALDRAMAEMLHPYDEKFFDMLKKFEHQVLNQDIIAKVEEKFRPIDPSSVEILDYAPEYRQDFERLNREWLEKFFKVETIDELYFKDPENSILAKGGHILFAKIGNEIIGTCALVREGDYFELCKMSVDPRYRGFGIGKKLIEALIQKGKESDADKIVLLTDAKLKNAIHLYQSLGFQHVDISKAQKDKYPRANICMEIAL